MTKPYRRLELAGASVAIYSNPTGACQAAAERIISSIPLCVEVRGRAVLGLATGATPEPVYARLVEAYKEGSLSFSTVSTYNLDEYYPMGPFDPNSYRSYMHRHLFAHIDLAANRSHVLDGTVPEELADEHASAFDRWIGAEGGLDVQLLGLGRNGHIGFNEPTDLPVERALALRTRLVELHPTTIADAARDFGGEEYVPRRALTMGVASILAARSIVVLAFGERKAEAVARSLRGPITAEVPGSLLQTVPGKVHWMIDQAAASGIL
jgi:glucosamine-6-phosphate deaminase